MTATTQQQDKQDNNMLRCVYCRSLVPSVVEIQHGVIMPSYCVLPQQQQQQQQQQQHQTNLSLKDVGGGCGSVADRYIQLELGLWAIDLALLRSSIFVHLLHNTVPFDLPLFPKEQWESRGVAQRPHNDVLRNQRAINPRAAVCFGSWVSIIAMVGVTSIICPAVADFTIGAAAVAEKGASASNTNDLMLGQLLQQWLYITVVSGTIMVVACVGIFLAACLSSGTVKGAPWRATLCRIVAKVLAAIGVASLPYAVLMLHALVWPQMRLASTRTLVKAHVALGQTIALAVGPLLDAVECCNSIKERRLFVRQFRCSQETVLYVMAIAVIVLSNLVSGWSL